MKVSNPVEQAAFSVTRAVGSIPSIFVHTVLFLGSFLAVSVGLIEFDRMLLVLTTLVSLEAIYLAIFIQMTVNHQADTIAEVEQNIDEIQEDIDEIQEDVDEIQEDVEEMSEDVEHIEKSDIEDEHRKSEQRHALHNIESTLRQLAEDIERLKSSPLNAAKAAPDKDKS